MQSLSPATVPSVKPVSRASKTPGPSRPQSRIANHQPTRDELKSVGIRVRDFAYESKLPPLPTIYRHPQQVQPGIARPLGRTVTEPDESQSQSQSQSQTTRKLERTATEIIEEPPAPIPPAKVPGVEGPNIANDATQPLNNGLSRRPAQILDESMTRDTDSATAPTEPFLSSIPQLQADTGRSHPQGEGGSGTTKTSAEDLPNSQTRAPTSRRLLPEAPSSSPIAVTSNQRSLRSRAPILGTTSSNDLLNPTRRYNLRKRPTPPAPAPPPKPSKRPRLSTSSRPSTRRKSTATRKSATSSAKGKDNSKPSTRSSRPARQSNAASRKKRPKRS